MTHQIPAHEHGVVRIFALSSDIDMAIAHDGTLASLELALGVLLKDDDVQIIKIETVSELGLSTFLEMAYAIIPEDLAAQRDAVNALTGTIAVIRSGAFGGDDIIIHDDMLVATLHEEGGTRAGLAPLTATSAEGILDAPTKTKPPKSDARIGGMIATYALIFMFALVGLMIWIAR